MLWRTFILIPALVMLSSATAPNSSIVPSAKELSEAVASVDDWRAMGIFFFAVFLVQLVSNGLSRRQERLDTKEDRKALVTSLDALTKELSSATKAQIIHIARTESVLARVERFLEDLK